MTVSLSDNFEVEEGRASIVLGGNLVDLLPPLATLPGALPGPPLPLKTLVGVFVGVFTSAAARPAALVLTLAGVPVAEAAFDKATASRCLGVRGVVACLTSAESRYAYSFL